FAKHLARAVELFGLHARRNVVVTLSRIERHHDLFERGVARALADAVERALDLPRAVLDRGKTVGDSQAQIVMAMGADGDSFGVLESFAEGADQLAVFGGRLIAYRVRYIDDGGSGIDYGIEDRAQIVDLGAARVFGGELYFVAELARPLDCPDRDIQRFAAGL